MDAKEWAIEAFESCDHAGMICMDCAEKAIRAAMAEERARLLCEARESNGDPWLPEAVHHRLVASKKL